MKGCGNELRIEKDVALINALSQFEGKYAKWSAHHKECLQLRKEPCNRVHPPPAIPISARSFNNAYNSKRTRTRLPA